MPYYSADYIIPVSSEPVRNGVIQVDEEGVIIKLGQPEDFPSVDIHRFPGVIMPGFVNAHCHLELSHMEGLCDTGTGLIAFISRVVKLREFDKAVIMDAIRKRDAEMYEAGIQAVGDICNKADTAECKDNSPIHYHSFIELFDLLQPAMTDQTIRDYQAVYRAQSDEGLNRKTYVPHAPYSVTPGLFDFINSHNPPGSIISMHNQETADENELFLTGRGGFGAFYRSLGLSIDEFKAPGTGSLAYALNHLQPSGNLLLVHNTLTAQEDIERAASWSPDVFWVSCPNANLFIENRLPDYSLFRSMKATVCLGTDSIMSNWQLSIWEEIKTIKKYQSYIPLGELIRWGTLNGAQALEYDKLIGSLEPGKAPGLIHVNLEWRGDETQIGDSVARRIL